MVSTPSISSLALAGWDGDLPVFDVGAAGEGVADNEGIVGALVQSSPSFVGYWDIGEGNARLKREAWEDGYVLIDKGGEWIFCTCSKVLAWIWSVCCDHRFSLPVEPFDECMAHLGWE